MPIKCAKVLIKGFKRLAGGAEMSIDDVKTVVKRFKALFDSIERLVKGVEPRF